MVSATISQKLRTFGVSLVLVITFAGSPQIRGQVSGATILGTIADPSGAVVPNATISIKDLATGVTRTTTANSVGLYTAPNLLPGNYEVTVSAPGFSAAVATGISLTVGAQKRVDIALAVGTTTNTVQVTGAATTIELTRSSISATVSGSEVRELPLNGRDWAELATLEPGVEASRTQAPIGALGTGDVTRVARGLGDQLSISGMRPSQNSYRLDGISFNDYTNDAPGGVLGNLSGVDAIQEFSVLTANYSAEYGKTSGGIINAITRSGTNQFHGDVYEFLRNSALDAANFIDNENGVPKPPFRRNQFGGSAGGPISRGNNTFGFFNYEGLRQSLSTTNVNTVPSPNARNGILASGPIPGGVNNLVIPYLGLWPLPNGPLLGNGDTGVFSFVAAQHGTENFYTARVDHRFSGKDSLSGSFIYDNNQVTTPAALDQVLFVTKDSRVLASLEETHIFSPDLVNSVRFGFSRNHATARTPKAINPLAADLTLGMLPGQPAPRLVMPGITTSNGLGGACDFRFPFNSFQAYDDAFLTHSKHSLKFGFTFERMQSNQFVSCRKYGEFDFGSLTNFLTNVPRALSSVIGAPTPRELRQSLFGGYIQDDWRWRPNLTLNLGLRYEMVTVPTDAQNKLASLVRLTDSQPHLGSPYFANPTLRNFEPRVGFAWDPFRNGETAVRGGFGMFDVLPLPYLFLLPSSASFPFNIALTTQNVPPGSFPKTALSALGSQFPQLVKHARVISIDQHPSRSYVMQWNLNIQQEIARHFSVSVAYVGSRGVHLPFKMDDVNTVIPTKTPQGYLFPSPAGSGTVLNPNFGELDDLIFGSDSIYHALHLGTKISQFHGLQLQASYTWGKSIDAGSASNAGDQVGNSIQSMPFFFDSKIRRAVSDFDIRQNLVISALWAIGNARSLPAVAGWALNGWKLGAIFAASTGAPFTPTIGGDPLGMNNSVPWDYLNRLTGSGCQGSLGYTGNPNKSFKTQCFALPNPVTLMGNSGRNIVTGPGLSNLDFSLFKDNYIKRISESFNLQFRAEFFNILNHANFQPALDNSTIFNQDGSPVGNGGAIDATVTPSRQIQFGLKLVW